MVDVPVVMIGGAQVTVITKVVQVVVHVMMIIIPGTPLKVHVQLAMIQDPCSITTRMPITHVVVVIIHLHHQH